jgi:hypothetical protein
MILKLQIILYESFKRNLMSRNFKAEYKLSKCLSFQEK